jgi:gliding motility associated protien GldN
MKTLVKIFLFAFLPVFGFAQQGVRFTEKFGPFSDIYEMENDFTNRKPISYPFVNESDVLWSKVTWELVDLREKRNLPLYYPTDSIHGRMSLINAIMNGLEKKQFDAFKVPIKNNAFEFDLDSRYANYEDVKNIGKSERIEHVEISPGVFQDSLVKYMWKTEEIKQYIIKEVWYFDKKDARLRCEIIGICPVREYMYNGTVRRTRLFWLYYPEMRNYLATLPVYSMENDKPLYSFDDLFVYRYYGGYFIQEANVYNDRLITDYVIGREAQLESQKIKDEIFNYEQDMWEN